MDADARPRIAAMYRRFAEAEAPGRTPLYGELARAVAADDDVLEWLAAMERSKRQPNLLFAAARRVAGAPPSDAAAFLAVLADRRDAVAAVMRTHTTQTNEPARCATLLPFLATLPQPLALLEVGAAAGLCLLPDYYRYRYGDATVEPTADAGVPAPRFDCRLDGVAPPAHDVEVVWRAGLDLSPVDIDDPDAVAWLHELIWPGQEDRAERLDAALDVARAVRPRVVRGNLLRDVEGLAAQAPADATLVIFHTAVLAYVHDAADRAAFARTVASIGARWLANEAPTRIPGVDATLAEAHPDGMFLVALDGRPVARADPHGAALESLP